jgi:peptidoglycan/xylan/chitin deacetylase (PgdA/CDA1 family)
MALNRREALQIVALGAVAAGCSTAHSRARARSASAPSASSSGAATPTDSPSPTASTASHRHKSAPEIVHGRRTTSSIALTFHGAGDPAIARAVFRELAQAHVHATVLAVGTWLEGEPTMAKAVLNGGHELGNHTQHHLPMRSLDAATALREIVECARTLHQLTGSTQRWFRASGTQYTTRLIRVAAAQAGYAQCLSYDVDSLDWTDPGPDAIVANVLAKARAGSIVSMHLGHRGTVDALGPLLSGLQSKSLHPVTVSELVG